MPRVLRFLLVAASLAALLPGTSAGAAASGPARLDLAGEWRFALDRAAEQRQAADATSSLPPGDGIAQHWFNRTLTNRIRLPGILQAQGYGDEINVDTPWVLTLGEAWWKLQPEALREHFSQPGHVEVPFLSQPPRHYLGVAWYQRDLEIPADWQGRHFKLFLERPHWQTAVWVDDTSFPPNDSLVAPHITDLGVLTPGRHRLTIRIDNRTQLPARGHLLDGHSVSDALGATWNGVVGRLELTATAPVWIEDAQVFPNVEKKSAVIKVKIGNATGQPGSGTIVAGTQSAPATWDAAGGQAEMEVPLGAAAKAWDEFHPNLQHLAVTLESHDDIAGIRAGETLDSVALTFGLREITHEDKNLLLNGHPLNLRMTHDGGDFPLTGYPATDAATWKRIIQVCQTYGLNGIRFHSWCPPEAAFTAADELGFYLQPECGMWNDFGSPKMRQRLNEETERALRAYGNHPSFILFSPSNEPRGYQRVTPQWAAAFYKKDSRRLYAAGTGWNEPQMSGPQYATQAGFGGLALRNSSGWFGRDYREALEDVHIPVLAHEVGQWCAYPDFNVIKKFTGYLRPGNYDIFRYLAEQEGVLGQDAEFAWASGRFQVECYKEEIEANLRTPGLSGFQLLDLHDYLGQGTALVGVVDAFWQPKSYVTATEFRRFAGPTVPLARLAHRTFTTDETLESDVEIYHFGENPIEAAAPYWKIVDAKGQTLAGGQWTNRDIPVGKNIPLGKIRVGLSALPAPAACKLVVGLRGIPVENDWNIWLYPADAKTGTPTSPADVLITSAWPEAAGRLAAGGKVLFIPDKNDLDPAKSPAMKTVPVFWNIQMTVRPPANPRPKFDAMLGLLCDTSHAALSEFPTEKNCDWQWTPIINNVKSVNLSSAPRALKPIIAAIDDWNRNWRLGVVFECNVGPGRLMVSAINIDKRDTGAEPELGQLRRSLLDYMAGPDFKPAASLTSTEVAALWSANPAEGPKPTRTFDPDLNDGTLPTLPARRPSEQ
jgi:beta-galactosidase